MNHILANAQEKSKYIIISEISICFYRSMSRRQTLSICMINCKIKEEILKAVYDIHPGLYLQIYVKLFD